MDEAALGRTGRWVLRPMVHPLDPDELGGAVDVPRALVALSSRRGLVALDSVGGRPHRWSIVGFDPFDDFSEPGRAPRSLAELESRLAALDVDLGAGHEVGPFAGGFLGALSYDLGVAGEELRLPAPAWAQPLVVGGLYRDWIVVQHATAEAPTRAWLVVSELVQANGAGAERAEQRAQAVLADLASASPVVASEPPAPAPAGGPRRTTSSAEHRARIERIRAEIARGEVYQANIAHRMESPVASTDVELYLHLRRVNPAPYMGFVRFPLPGGEEGALLSASPELLVEFGVGRGGLRVARTRPIKGTIGRGATFLQDAALRAALLASAKDRAELAMIVDLERNDLGRVAVPGGVEVGEFPTIETYASVHHLVCDVRAVVRDDVTAMGVVAALFPGGSITGAPKLRSMELIAREEREGRGFFTGSLGFVDARGHAALNILIRTFVFRRGADGRAEVSFHVGGGITWASDPASEDEETQLKADGLLRALGQDPGTRLA